MKEVFNTLNVKSCVVTKDKENGWYRIYTGAPDMFGEFGWRNETTYENAYDSIQIGGSIYKALNEAVPNKETFNQLIGLANHLLENLKTRCSCREFIEERSINNWKVTITKHPSRAVSIDDKWYQKPDSYNINFFYSKNNSDPDDYLCDWYEECRRKLPFEFAKSFVSVVAKHVKNKITK